MSVVAAAVAVAAVAVAAVVAAVVAVSVAEQLVVLVDVCCDDATLGCDYVGVDCGCDYDAIFVPSVAQ